MSRGVQVYVRPPGLEIGDLRIGQRCRLADRARSRQPFTIDAVDVLLSKLQIIELNEKDVRDTVALLLEHDVTDDDAGVNATQFAQLCCEDWGLCHTITRNLTSVRERVGRYDVDGAVVATRVDALLERIEAGPKSRSWRIRAKVGERKRWYELPEEV